MTELCISECTTALPIPWAPPVTRATIPFRDMIPAAEPVGLPLLSPAVPQRSRCCCLQRMFSLICVADFSSSFLISLHTHMEREREREQEGEREREKLDKLSVTIITGLSTLYLPSSPPPPPPNPCHVSTHFLLVCVLRSSLCRAAAITPLPLFVF